MIWPFGKSKNNKVFLATGHLDVAFYNRGDIKFMPSAELKEWLLEYKGQYGFKYDPMTGKRWIEFNDNNVAVMCRLVFA
jgi:hypothetical protein